MDGPKILLVDDEPAYHSIIKALLAHANLTVDAVPDAPAAFRALRTQRYDLILMDIEMAGINGYRGASHIRGATDWSRRAPIIAFTAERPETGEQHFIARGFDGWLRKPLQTADLAALLARWSEVDLSALADHAIEDRLSLLVGAMEAHTILERFRANLTDAIAAIDAGANPRPFGHSVGGMAGALGMPALSAAWLVLQEGRTAAWPTVRWLTQEAISELGQASGHFASAS